MTTKHDNNIRPVKIRVINPSPKKSLTEKQVENESLPRPRQGFLVSLICLAAYLFFLLDYLGFFSPLRDLSSWKVATFKAIIFYCLVLFLPFFLYALTYSSPEHLAFLRKNNPLDLLCLVMGFPFAYLVAFLNISLSILLFKLGITMDSWRPAIEAGLFPKHPLVQVLYLLVFCLLPAVCYEVCLRYVFLSENLKVMSVHTAIILSSLVTGLLTFKRSDLAAFIALGLLLSFIYKRLDTCLPTILCHLSFTITYRYLLAKIDVLKLDSSVNNYRGLETYFPLILKGLLSASVFVPLFIIFSQVTQVNPLLAKEQDLPKKGPKAVPASRLSYLAVLALAILFILVAK